MTKGSSTSRPARLAIRCPSRLHFGLVAIAPTEPHCFGGLGVAIDEPRTHLSVSLDMDSLGFDALNSIEAPTSIAKRIGDTLERLQAPQAMPDSASLRIQHRRLWTAHQLPDAHSGLGSGTQLACAVATLHRALDMSTQNSLFTADVADLWHTWRADAVQDEATTALQRLAMSSGRGHRSFVGLAVHLHGGMIFDRGLEPWGRDRRRIERWAVPEDWRVLLIKPLGSDLVSGEQEVSYFAKCCLPNPFRERMLRLIEESLVPSIIKRDLTSFGEALYEYGWLGGKIFEPVQGGVFRDTRVASVVAWLRDRGIQAVGQTSWGPTVYAIVENAASADEVAQWLVDFDLAHTVRITKMTNRPAELAWLDARSGGLSEIEYSV